MVFLALAGERRWLFKARAHTERYGVRITVCVCACNYIFIRISDWLQNAVQAFQIQTFAQVNNCTEPQSIRNLITSSVLLRKQSKYSFCSIEWTSLEKVNESSLHTSARKLRLSPKTSLDISLVTDLLSSSVFKRVTDFKIPLWQAHSKPDRIFCKFHRWAWWVDPALS